MKEVTIYTDGACSGNPGPGGYGVILIHGKHRKELSAGYKFTTNNRMELRGIIAGLEALKVRCKVDITTDSRYIVDAINLGWVYKWKSKGWKRNNKDRALNVDLWQQILRLMEMHTVQFHWVRGHAGHPLNERCDELAVEASQQEALLEDAVEYITEPTFG
jgi:ribonuclease HI